MTDFRIAALSIKELGWEWKTDATAALYDETNDNINEGTERLADMSLESIDIKPDLSAETASTEVNSSKKDGKHKRDEDDEDIDGADVQPKKVKPDTGESVTLSEVKVEPPSESLEGPKPEGGDSEKHSSDADKPKTSNRPNAPATRENSRLRIYFSSPTTAVVKRLRGPSERATSILSTATYSTTRDEREEHRAELADEDGVDGVPVPDDQHESPQANADANSGEEETSSTVEAKGATKVVSTDSAVDLEDDAPGEQVGQPSETKESNDPVNEAASQPSPSEEPADDSFSTAIDQSDQVTVGTNDDPENQVEREQIEPSADRVSIAYARNTRRLIIDASVIESLKVRRAAGLIELTVKLENAVSDGVVDSHRLFKGVIVSSSIRLARRR